MGYREKSYPPKAPPLPNPLILFFNFGIICLQYFFFESFFLLCSWTTPSSSLSVHLHQKSPSNALTSHDDIRMPRSTHSSANCISGSKYFNENEQVLDQMLA